MDTLSSPTIGLLTQIAVQIFYKDELITLLLRADLDDERYVGYDPGGTSKHGLVRAPLRGARELARNGDKDAHAALLAFVRVLVEKSVADPDADVLPGWFAPLREALLGDGYQLCWDREEQELSVDFGPARTRVTVIYRILPTDSGPVPLADEISALERELGRRGYAAATSHFRQAVDSFCQHHYEAANGQLRTTLEALVVGLAEDHTGFVKNPNAGGGGQAITHLLGGNHLPEGDGGKMLAGLWKVIHTNGPHPGQSTADEARIRMQLVTATARFLLNHFPAGT